MPDRDDPSGAPDLADGDPADAPTPQATLALAAPKPAVEDRIASLEAEGVYDDARRVVARDDDTVLLPITAPPSDTPGAVVAQDSPERRQRGLESLLRDRGWTDDEVAAAPSSWAVVGTVVLVAAGDYPKPSALGDALLDLHGNADTVVVRGGVDGELREPSIEVLAGHGHTETVHVEHGTRYALDLREVMFSPGNQAERVRMGDVVELGERVLDLFAGIGYFALPMARAGAHVTAVEKNPEAFRYLIENAQLNDVAGNLDAVLGDCRDVDAQVDRAVLGYYDALGGGPESVGDGDPTTADSDDPGYVAAALRALDAGGVMHVHATCPDHLLWDRPEARLHDAAAAAGREVGVRERRVVKSHSEGVQHVVLDVDVLD
jgi:tRNA wybutosine-synthesizing protein 2